MAEDSDLVRRVKAALTVEPRVAAAHAPIEVDVLGGVAVLRGRVPRLSVRGAAEVAARRVPGVVGVRNELLVGSPDRTDVEVQQAVFDAFTQDPYIDERLVRVAAARGIVTLEGEVQNLTRKRLAGGLAWWRRGVAGVVNNLRTREPTTPELEADDDLLAEGVRFLLEKDPLVVAVEVGVISQGRVVLLTGAVRSPEERDAAEDDAWATLGVEDVRNELEVVPEARPQPPGGP